MWFGLRRDERTRFIFRHGVVPWGLVAGAGAAIAGVLGARADADATTDRLISTAGLAGVAVLCFVVWCVIAGWVVGAIRWQLRESDAAKRPPRTRHRP
jgi:hypothetical protein